jgi:4-hydroxy-4-methyl-2-oxoglutarate aldolase
MNSNELSRPREPGVATVYEASGRVGLVDAPLIQRFADGAVCVKPGRVGAVMHAAEERLSKETVMRQKLLAGALSYDLHGLRAHVEGNKP